MYLRVGNPQLPLPISSARNASISLTVSGDFSTHAPLLVGVFAGVLFPTAGTGSHTELSQRR